MLRKSLVLAALLLAGCSNAMQITYTCTGTAEQIAVTYQEPEGQIIEETVSQPWEVTFTANESAELMLEATNTGDEGTLDCAILVDDTQVTSTSGETHIRMAGDVNRRGSETTSNFASEYTNRPTAIPTPAATRTPLVGSLILINQYTHPLCGLFLMDSDDEVETGTWSENYMADLPPIEPDTQAPVEVPQGKFNMVIEDCDGGAVAFSIPIDIFAETEHTVGTASYMTLINESAFELCSLRMDYSSRMRSPNLIPDDPVGVGDQRRFVIQNGEPELHLAACTGEEYTTQLETWGGMEFIVVDEFFMP